MAERKGTLETGPPDRSPAPTPRLHFTSWSLVRSVILVAVGIIAVDLMIAAGTVLWWLAIATVIAAVMQPAVSRLRRHLPRWLAIIIVIFGSLAIVGLLGYRGQTELSNQMSVLQSDATRAARDIQSSSQFGQVATEFGLLDKTGRFFEKLPIALGGKGGLDEAAATVQSAASSGSALFAIAMFALLMLIFGPRFMDSGLQQIDDEHVRARIAMLLKRSYRLSSRYVSLMALRALAVGIGGWLTCWLLGFETPTVLGMGFAVGSLIPGIGIVLAAMPVAVFTAITSVPTALIVVIGALIVQILDSVFVQKRIEQSSVHVGPGPTLVAAMIGLQLYGLGGVLVAMATAVYGLAVLQGIATGNDDMITAVRGLVGDDDDSVLVGSPTFDSGTVVATGSATVVASEGVDVVVAEREPTDEGGGP